MLARCILDNKQLVAGRNVLDLGSGCGAVSIAAIKAGANHVIANDIDEDAKTALEANMDINLRNEADKVVFSSENYLLPPFKILDENISLILIGDMFYDEEMGKSVLNLCDQCREKKVDVVLGDPGRWFLQSSSHLINSMFDCVARYQLSDETRRENFGLDTGLVWRLKF